jgi:hypothetical protein
MAQVGSITIDERDVMGRATLEVEIVVKRDWRVWIGLRLMRLGARLSGVRYREVI